MDANQRMGVAVGKVMSGLMLIADAALLRSSFVYNDKLSGVVAIMLALVIFFLSYSLALYVDNHDD